MFGNDGSGLSVGSPSSVVGNALFSNGTYGIYMEFGAGSTVQQNALGNHSGFALFLGSSVSYLGNSITTFDPTHGTVSGGVNAGQNVCDGSPICP